MNRLNLKLLKKAEKITEPLMISFILGTPFCGSTIFANILSTGRDVFNCGEIDRIDGLGYKENTYSHNSYCINCDSSLSNCSFFTEDFIKQLSSNASTPFEIYKALSQRAKKRILLDGSKHAYWLRQTCQDESTRARSRAIVLVRRPTSFMHSHMHTHPAAMSKPWLGSSQWRDTYSDIMRTLFALGIPFIIVRYEDLAHRFSETISHSASWFGIDQPDTSGMYNFSHLHTLGGNPGISSGERSTISPQGESKTLFKVVDEEHSDLAVIAQQTPGLTDLAINFFGYSRL